jgi:nucleoside-diphosphate-sugar epimerase
MDQVTVLGITGGIGSVFAQACLRRGWRVRALVRDPSKVAVQEGLEVVTGDARDPEALRSALRGSDTVFHGINLPYPQWDPGMRQLTAAVLSAAEQAGATVLFPGNLYGLGPDFAEPLGEDASRRPPSRKGALRNDLEDQLAASSAQTLVLRMGDFFGGPGDSNWMHHLTDEARQGGAIQYPGPREVLHSWCYLPDAAAVLVALRERRSELSSHEVFHFEGHVVDGHGWVQAVREALGDPGRAVKPFPWMWMQLARPFVPMVRELFEMRYLWQQPVRMRQGRLVAFLGEVPHTPLADAVRASVLPTIPEGGLTLAGASAAGGS